MFGIFIVPLLEYTFCNKIVWLSDFCELINADEVVRDVGKINITPA